MIPTATWPDSRAEPVQQPAPLLELPAHALVVLAGLPGAGKTTLLRRLADTPGVRALDSEDVAAWLARLPVPYRWLRPLVHTLHLIRVALAVHTGAACVLTTDPFTSPARRWLLRRLAGVAGRQLHVTLITASAAQARAGREQRGRDLPAARVTRHEDAYDSLFALADHHLTRDAAAHVTATVTSATTSSRDKEGSMSPAQLRKRPAIGIAAVATALGLWFGLTAPTVSPVLEGPGGVNSTIEQVAVVDQDDDGRDADVDGGGRRGGGPDGGPR